MILDQEKTKQHIIKWIRDYAQGANIKRLYVNVCDLDSALVALLCKETKIITVAAIGVENQDIIQFCKDYTILNFIMDTTNLTDDIRRYYDPALFGIKLKYDNAITSVLDACIKTPILSCMADTYNGLIVGTKNRCELKLIRNYNKYGEGAVDLLPIGDMFKSETYELFKYMVTDNNNTALNSSYKILNTYSAIIPGKLQCDQLQLTYNEVEWADRQNILNNIVVKEEDPVRHKDWQRYTSRQREIIAKIHQIEKRTRHKYNQSIPICTLRNIPGILQ